MQKEKYTKHTKYNAVNKGGNDYGNKTIIRTSIRYYRTTC